MIQQGDLAKRMSQLGMVPTNKRGSAGTPTGTKYQDKVRESSHQRNDSGASIFKDANRSFNSDLNDREDQQKLDQNVGNFFDKQNDDLFDTSSKGNQQKRKDPLAISNKIEKRQKSPPKPLNWNKLNERERADAFVTTYKNNLDLKQKQNVLENELKKMQTQLNHFQQSLRSNSRNLVSSSGPRKGPFDNTDPAEVETLKLENQRLKEKIEALAQVKKLIQAKKPPAQKLMASIAKQQEIRIEAGMPEEERQKLSDMLKMIDTYKKQLKNADEEIKKLQEAVLKQDRGFQTNTEAQLKLKELQQRQDTVHSHFEANKQRLEQTKRELQEVTQKFQKEQLINQDMRSEIDILKNEVKHYEKLEEELTQVRADKRSVEKQLQQLAIDPLFRDFKDQSSNEIKYREAREENLKIKEELKMLKEMNDKLNEKTKLQEKTNLELTDELARKRSDFIQVKTELEIVRKGTLAGDKLTDYSQSDFLDALGLVKWDGKDPKWRNLELTEKTRAQDQLTRIGDNPNELKKKVEHLILEKGELGLHLERQATMLRTKIEIDKEKERLHAVEVEQLNQQLKIARNKAEEISKLAEIKGYALEKSSKGPMHVYERDNVKYTSPIDEFSTDDIPEESLGQGENILDLFIGQLDVDEAVCLRTSQKIKNLTDMLSFVSVDFYNHETQYTTVVDGKSNTYNFQASFKVCVDEFFIQFLKERYLKLEFYCAQQQDAILLGSTSVSMAQLITENTQPGISAVIEQDVKIRSARKGAQDQFVACLKIKFRMRFPINRSIEWAQEKLKLNMEQIKEEEEKEMFRQHTKKRLVIKIDKGQNFFPNSQLFVFFTFNGQDYFSPTQLGPDPSWNWETVIDVYVDEEFRSLIKNQGIKFTVFNDLIDNVAATEEEYNEEDIVGTGNMNLKNLIDGDVVYPQVKIIGKTLRGQIEERGQLHVLVYWYEGWGEEYKPKYEHMLLAKDWENKITRQIADSFRSKGLALTTAYYVMNRDQDQVISQEDFYSTIRETMGLKIPDEELDVYYHRLPKPFSKQNFETVFRGYLLDTSPYSEDAVFQSKVMMGRNGGRGAQPGQEDYIPISSRINNLTTKQKQEFESARLKICALLSKKMKHKTPAQIFKEIDEDGNGQISLFNLSSFLSYAGWKIDKEQVMQFLRVVDFNKDGNISLEEFKEFVYNNLGQNTGSIEQRQMDHFVSNVKLRILEYLKANSLSFNDLFKIIDNDRSGFISTLELMVFLLEKLGLKMKFEEIAIIVQTFDVNNDDQIDFHEFIDGIRREAETNGSKYESLFLKEKSQLSTIEYICDQLNNHMVKNKKTRGQLFDTFDEDSDKFISKQEMKQSFQQLNIPLSQNQLTEFYSFIDKNGDERVSIQEFIQALKAELNRLEKTGKLGKSQNLQGQEQATPTPQPFDKTGRGSIAGSGSFRKQSQVQQSELSRNSVFGGSALSVEDELKQKIARSIKKNKNQYQTQFDKTSKGTNYISQEDFQMVLETVSGDFSSSEIDTIIKTICKQDARGNVLVSSFLTMENFQSSLSLSQSGLTNAQLTKSTFSRIGRILREKKIDYEHAFNRFDIDHNNSISLKEFKLTFNQLQLNLKEADIEEMFHFIDKKNTGEIKIEEFVAVMANSQF